MGRFLMPGLTLVLALIQPAAAHARVVERIAAVVGNDVILSSEVEEKAAPFMNDVASITNQVQRAARASALRREVLDRLIDEQLILQQAAEFKVSVASEDVDRSIDQIKKENSLTDDQLRAALAQQNMTMATYRQDIRRQMLRFRVINIAVGSKVSVADSELRAYYDRQAREGTDFQVRVAHIFIAIPEGADVGVTAERQKLAASLTERARMGEDFAVLAREFSEDPATRNDGGDLGAVGRDMLPKPIEEAVFALKAGEISSPVRAEHGFHVLKVLERKTKDLKPFDEMKDELRIKLRQREVDRQTKSFLADLRKKTLVDVRL